MNEHNEGIDLRELLRKAILGFGINEFFSWALEDEATSPDSQDLTPRQGHEKKNNYLALTLKVKRMPNEEEREALDLILHNIQDKLTLNPSDEASTEQWDSYHFINDYEEVGAKAIVDKTRYQQLFTLFRKNYNGICLADFLQFQTYEVEAAEPYQDGKIVNIDFYLTQDHEPRIKITTGSKLQVRLGEFYPGGLDNLDS
jgi:hypothetical protein